MLEKEFKVLENKFFDDNVNMHDLLEETTGLLEQDPENRKGLFLKFNILLELKEYEKCIELCDSMLERQPDDAEAITAKSTILIEYGQFKQAIDLCQHAINIDDKCLDAYFNWDTAYNRSGDKFLPKPPPIPKSKGTYCCGVIIIAFLAGLIFLAIKLLVYLSKSVNYTY